MEKNAYEVMKTFHMIAKTVGVKEEIIWIKRSYMKAVKLPKQYV